MAQSPRRISLQYLSLLRLTQFADASSFQDSTEDFVIPDNFAELDDATLSQLQADALAAFEVLYAGGTNVTNEVLEQMKDLAVSLEKVNAEVAARSEASASRAAEAAELAARITQQNGTDILVDDDGNIVEITDEGAPAVTDPGKAVEDEIIEDTEAAAASSDAQSLAAGGGVTIPLKTLRRRSQESAYRALQTKSNAGVDGNRALQLSDVLTVDAVDTGFAAGTGINFDEAATALNRRLSSFKLSKWESAANSGKPIAADQRRLFSLHSPFKDDVTVKQTTDREHLQTVIENAVNQTRLKGGSLVASAGWCAPSEVVYDFFDSSVSTEGFISLPEIAAPRGGLWLSPGPDPAAFFNADFGFHATEEDAKAGKYAKAVPPATGNIVGDKECIIVDCPPFEEHRLEIEGLCIQADILQARSYPEYTKRFLELAVLGHKNKINTLIGAQILAGSTAKIMPSTQAGATAPLLTSIELEAIHYRDVRNLSENTVLEILLPRFTKGIIRADLSRRLGVDLIAVSNARISEWFRSLNINPQFVRLPGQNIADTPAANWTKYPTEITFVLYSAGTWVGVNDAILTIDTLYSSELLRKNIYTALFTESAIGVIKRGFDSRAVSVLIEPDGATHFGIEINADGTK